MSLSLTASLWLVSDAFATEMKRDHTFATSKDNFFSVPVKSEDDGTRSSGHFRESQSFLYQVIFFALS